MLSRSPSLLPALLLALSLIACSSAPPDLALPYLREGEAALAEGASRRAVVAYQRAVEVAPLDPRGRRGLLAAQIAAGDGEAALRSLAWFETRAPALVDPCPALSLAVEDRIARAPLAAEAPARRAVERTCPGAGPRLSSVLVALADEAERSGEEVKAIAFYGEAIALDPGVPHLFLRAAELLLKQGRPAEAVSLLSTGLEAHPDDRPLRDLMVRALTIDWKTLPPTADDRS